MHPLLQRFESQIQDLCATYRVRRLELFGSAARGADDPNRSDLDFLVEFEAIRDAEYKASYFAVLHGLEDLLGRRVDLVDVSTIDNPRFLRAIEPDRTVVYAG